MTSESGTNDGEQSHAFSVDKYQPGLRKKLVPADFCQLQLV